MWPSLPSPMSAMSSDGAAPAPAPGASTFAGHPRSVASYAAAESMDSPSAAGYTWPIPSASANCALLSFRHLPSFCRSLTKKRCTLDQSTASAPGVAGRAASSLGMEPPGDASEKAPFSAIAAAAADTTSSFNAFPTAASSGNSVTFRFTPFAAAWVGSACMRRGWQERRRGAISPRVVAAAGDRRTTRAKHVGGVRTWRVAMAHASGSGGGALLRGKCDSRGSATMEGRRR
mmetsp:Transcript_9939/g.25353  ORF Transcript_9939/g.25353 Transcript_9939/m.25353 type:complete len:232 (+) Transcript_9939:236-931(+)